MHSIVMPSSPAFFNDILLYRKSNSMLPFPALNHAAIITKKDTISRCRNLGSSGPFGLLQSDDLTTLCSTGSPQSVYVADTVGAPDRFCAKV